MFLVVEYKTFPRKFSKLDGRTDGHEKRKITNFKKGYHEMYNCVGSSAVVCLNIHIFI